MATSILSSCTMLPELAHTHEEALVYYRKWVSGKSSAFRRKAECIFEAAAIDEKHTVADGDVLFNDRSLSESSDLYHRESIRLGGQLLKEALATAGVCPDDVTAQKL